MDDSPPHAGFASGLELERVTFAASGLPEQITRVLPIQDHIQEDENSDWVKIADHAV